MFDVVLVMPAANRFDKVSLRIPNGLLAIAARPVQSGYSVKIIDLKTDPNWQNTLKESCGPNTLCVGITCSTGRMISSALAVAQTVREINPALPLVWGGPHPTLVPGQTLAHPLVDIVVINEGEVTFFELLKALRDKKDLSSVEGIGYKKDGEKFFTPNRELISNIDTLPLLPYHILDISPYSSLNINGERSIDIMTSRGCPHECTFCPTPITSGRKWRPMSVSRIMETIDHLYDRYGVRSFYFSDDNFMTDLRRVEEFCDMILKSGKPIHWGTQGVTVSTVKQMTDALLDKIEKSGCVELSIGIEAASPEILQKIHKQVSLDDVLAINRRLIRLKNVAVKYNMIIGFPGETIDQIKETLRLAMKLYKANPNVYFPFNIFTPFPGTPEYFKSIEHGFVPPDELEGWSKLESVGWGKYFKYWYNKRESDWLQSVNLTSYLAFPAAIQRVDNLWIRILFRIYRPFGYFRFANDFFPLHIEKYIFQWLDI